MKALLTMIAVLTMNTVAHAGFAPTRSCSNIGGYIQIKDFGNVVIAEMPEKITQLDRAEVEIQQTVLQSFPAETRGCSSSQTSFVQVTIAKKDGSAMPSAYNQNTDKGVLKAYMICEVSHAWMPVPGQSCN